MNEWKESLFNNLQQIKDKNNGQIDMNNTDEIIAQFLEVLKMNLVTSQEKDIFHQIKKMTSQITALKKDISNVNEEILEDNFIPKIAEELNLVVKHTEESVNKILDIFDEICGIISKVGPVSVKNELMSKSTKILEACNFQDIVGQRIKNITTNLISIESVLLKMLHAIHPEEALKDTNHNPEKDLLNGPKKGKNSPSQQEIDDLFASV